MHKIDWKVSIMKVFFIKRKRIKWIILAVAIVALIIVLLLVGRNEVSTVAQTFTM